MKVYRQGRGWFDIGRNFGASVRSSMAEFDVAKPGPLMAGKRGLIMGVANDRSIAWGIARALAGQGAELAFTYQDGAFGRRAVPLAKSIGAEIIEPVNVLDLATVDAAFARIKDAWVSWFTRSPTPIRASLRAAT